MVEIVVQLINFYQRYLSFDTGVLKFLAPGGACRYEVRCSEYTKIAIQEHGLIKGVFQGLKRIVSCR